VGQISNFLIIFLGGGYARDFVTADAGRLSAGSDLGDQMMFRSIAAK